MADVAADFGLHRSYRYRPKEVQLNVNLALNYAETLCQGGKLREALDVYETCARAVEITAERLTPLAKSVLDAAVQSAGPVRPQSPTTNPCLCAQCEDVFIQPVTLPCGHTFCRKCVSALCLLCNEECPGSLEVDVTVKNLVEKLWPLELESARLRDEGDDLLARNDAESALGKYNQALVLVGKHPLTLSCRSSALCRLGRPEAALEDAHAVVQLRPHWGKGYYLRGKALLGLGHREAALTSFCVTVVLGHEPQAVCSDVAKVLQEMLSKQHRDGQKNKNSPFSTPRTKSVRRARRYFHALSNTGSDDELSSADEDLLPPTSKLDLPLFLQSILDEVSSLKDKSSEERELKLDGSLIHRSDLNCVLCCRVVWRPVTTPCGHSYCRVCLDRSLDYSSSCPLCIKSLSHNVVSTPKIVNKFLEYCLARLLPEEGARRHASYMSEMAELVPSPQDTNPRIPIFVCTTTFPSVHCPLFIFEPRYRLMIRRCVESGAGRFGMSPCLLCPDGTTRFADYGTLLELRDWVLLADGCSILSTMGTRRFRTVSRDQTDGFDTAAVEFFTDVPVVASAVPALRHLHDGILSTARDWLASLDPDFRDQIHAVFGSMPALEQDWTGLEDGPAWAWWLIAVLPLGPQLKISILGTTSLEKRLRAIEKTLKYITTCLPLPYGVSLPRPITSQHILPTRS